ncbi:MAG: ABC transporter substrate-binding protein [Roseibium sp.]|uniref:ABC transporter substrate-binding protein n=1 Tax=Roseibium sp. TaxID=1936156 RepID=UPI001B139459|nr:ABC transporter substrate-binding protein [Roseibium sp.]MBO6895530.1 ABC transporter substrate-binding protein [Roseibium sp.]
MLERLVLGLALSVFGSFAGPMASMAQGQGGGDVVERRVHMVVWRGCEEACQGFIRYFEDRDLPVRVDVTDVARDRDLLPGVQARLIAERPDLVVTWGTTVSLSILGTRAEHGRDSALGDIPALFMIVADPVGSDLVESYQTSGRAHVSGVRNRVPEEVQLRLMFEYFRPERLGVLNHPGELNSTLNTENLRDIAQEFGFTLIEQLYTPDVEGQVPVAQIPEAMAALKAQGAEAIYVGSSSYNLDHQDAFVAAATALDLPVFSAYTQMVAEGGALMAIGTSYANVGRLAALQAADILLDGKDPEALPIKALNRYSVLLNMTSAQQLGLYPPLSLIGVAEVVQ